MRGFTIFVSILGLIALVFIVSLFFPRSYRVAKSTIINKPVQKTFNYLNNITYWKDWSPLDTSIDSTLVTFYSKTRAGENAAQYFRGNLVGSGRIRIIESIAGKKLRYNFISRLGPDVQTASMVMYFETSGNNTLLTCVDSMDVGYNPIFRFMVPSQKQHAEESFEIMLRAIKLAAETRL